VSSEPPFATRPTPAPGRVGIGESTLSPADRTTRTPPHWTGDIERPGAPPWVRATQDRHQRYLQPYLVPSVLPEISARLFNFGGVLDGTQRGAFDQILYLSFYALDIHVPTLVYRDNAGLSPQHYRVSVRLPAILTDQHALSVFFGGALPTAGTLSADAGVNSTLGYAFGSELFSAQLRLGIGKDRLVGEFEAPFRFSALYDATAALVVGEHFTVQLQVDGRRSLGGAGNAIRAWPGLRYFPLDRRSVSLGLSGLYWADQDAAGDWSPRRVGGYLDIGYRFL
jgi:hypothetical protein